MGCASSVAAGPSNQIAMNDSSTRIAALLHEAGETHHLVYRIVDGDDPDWASWYADWLLNLSELPQILGTTPVRSELVWPLVTLDKEYTNASPGTPRPHGYAERVAEHFAQRPTDALPPISCRGAAPGPYCRPRVPRLGPTRGTRRAA